MLPDWLSEMSERAREQIRKGLVDEWGRERPDGTRMQLRQPHPLPEQPDRKEPLQPEKDAQSGLSTPLGDSGPMCQLEFAYGHENLKRTLTRDSPRLSVLFARVRRGYQRTDTRKPPGITPRGLAND